jgi:hypothetical protein
MRVLPKMVDMAKSPAEQAESCMPCDPATQPIYPYGLCLSLGQDELDKLGLEDEGVEVGDMLHLFALCKVTSISKNDTASGKTTRIELQITHIAEENEDAENDEVDAEMPERRSKLYG